VIQHLLADFGVFCRVRVEGAAADGETDCAGGRIFIGRRSGQLTEQPVPFAFRLVELLRLFAARP
jgi:hypothetical protein